MTKDKTCADLVQGAFNSRMDAIRRMWEAEDQTTEEDGSLNDYGLSIDVVEANTFGRNQKPYIRYQLSWGGPSEEFRVKLNGKVEFWYLDWFDGAHIEVKGEDADIIKQIVEPVIPEDFNLN